MHTIHSRVVLALAGLALISWAFAIGVLWGLSNPSEGERYQPYRYAADRPFEVGEAGIGQPQRGLLEYRSPCMNPRGQGESDLCAQWKAVSAAEDSAFWTKLGFWIASIGSALLLWQIILTRKAVEETGEATEEMRKANVISGRVAAAELRPYLFVENLKLVDIQDVVEENKQDGEGMKMPRYFSARVSIHLHNYGKVPARNIRVHKRSYMARLYQGTIEKAHLGPVATPVCAPGHERRIFDHVFVHGRDVEEFKSGILEYIIRLRFTYEDDRGEEYSERADYRLSGDDLETFYLLLGPINIWEIRKRWAEKEPDLYDDVELDRGDEPQICNK